MKVRIAFTVDIDPDAWALEYGVPLAEVRSDVQDYVRYGVIGDFQARELLADD